MAILLGLRPAAYSSKDPSHDEGLGLVDAPRAGLLRHQIVPIADSAARHPVAHPPLETTVGLLGEVLQVQGVHRALQADVQLVDLALAHGTQAGAQVGKMLVERGHIRQVTRQAVERLRHDDLEGPLAGILQQLLVAGAKGRGAADRCVLILGDDGEALQLGVPPAHPHLVLDGRLALVVRAVAAVDGGARRMSLGVRGHADLLFEVS
jgi:hypothetical protein